LHRFPGLRRLALWPLALLLATCGVNALAQSWPDRPIKLVVPYPPAGLTDTLARLEHELELARERALQARSDEYAASLRCGS
jgi:tripartite-type tricarboxylate transporter receptor subunit TctC